MLSVLGFGSWIVVVRGFHTHCETLCGTAGGGLGPAEWLMGFLRSVLRSGRHPIHESIESSEFDVSECWLDGFSSPREPTCLLKPCAEDLLLMIEILHDLTYQNHRKNGRIVSLQMYVFIHMASCRIYIMNSSTT